MFGPWIDGVEGFVCSIEMVNNNNNKKKKNKNKKHCIQILRV